MPIYSYKHGLPNYCTGPNSNPLQSDKVIRQTVAGRSFLRRYVPFTLTLTDIRFTPPGSVFAVSLQSTSGTSAFPLHSSEAASVCDLPLLELYWFHALRQPLGSGVSPSTDLPSGTVCHQHYVRRICRRTPSSGH